MDCPSPPRVQREHGSEKGGGDDGRDSLFFIDTGRAGRSRGGDEVASMAVANSQSPVLTGYCKYTRTLTLRRHSEHISNKLGTHTIANIPGQ